MSAIIQLVGLASGEPTPFDGQYLVEYDPTRPGRSPDVCTAQRRAFYAALGREDGGEGGNAAGEP